MDQIEAYIYNCEGDQHELLMHLHQLLLSYPHVVAQFKYKVPFYYRKSWICYLLANKDGSVELSFPRAKEMNDDLNLLQFKERKMVASICLRKPTDLNSEVKALIQEALFVDENIPYTKKWFGKK